MPIVFVRLNYKSVLEMKMKIRYLALVLLCGCIAVSCRQAAPGNEEAESPTVEHENPTQGHAWSVPDLGMKFVWLKPGTFKMGSPASEEDRYDDEVQHAVVLTKGFWCGVYEVTQGEWKSLMGTSIQAQRDLVGSERDLVGSEWDLDGEGARLPMYYVSWDESVSFCEKLTARERGAGRIPVGYAYRLLTNSEWEYACRAGTTGPYAGALGDYGWYKDNSEGKTHEVGTKRANAWGLYDMHGNVYEWCLDWYGDYPSGRLTDPGGPADGQYRVLRGGCWDDTARYCRSASRGGYTPGYRYSNVGFRVSLAPVR